MKPPSTEPQRLMEHARRVVQHAWNAGEHVDVRLGGVRSLWLEHDPVTRDNLAANGEEVRAEVRFSSGELGGIAHADQGVVDLDQLVQRARERATGSASPVPPPLPAGEARPAAPSAERARSLGAKVAAELGTLGAPVQALVVHHECRWMASCAPGQQGGLSEPLHETVYVRLETRQGGVVESTGGVPLTEDALAAMTGRLASALETLSEPGDAPALELPMVLRPSVAAPLVAALAWLLRGSTAAAMPALFKRIGKQLFPACLSVIDDPCYPGATCRRLFDDEHDVPRRQQLIGNGTLEGFLHSRATAAQLGARSSGRGFRVAELDRIVPSPTNFLVAPAAGTELPDHYLELDARIETFSSLPRPGWVLLIAAGWEVRGGRRMKRVGPFDLNLPILETFRKLRSVGSDLVFLPAAEGCGTPTLVFEPLLSSTGATR